MVDEAGRRQDSAYAYLRPVMGPDGVPSLQLQMDNPVLARSFACTNCCLKPKHIMPVAGAPTDHERPQAGCDGAVIQAPLVPA
jgi:hypothetical protein